jgi:hypothetical protein
LSFDHVAVKQIKNGKSLTMTKYKAISSLGTLKNCFAHQNQLEKKIIRSHPFVSCKSKSICFAIKKIKTDLARANQPTD